MRKQNKKNIWGTRRQLAAIVSSAGLILASGCTALELDDAELGRATEALTSANGISENGLGDNGLNYNGLNYNGLNYNGLNYNGLGYNGLNYNGLNYNGLNYNGLVGNEVWKTWMTSASFTEQPAVFNYIVQCALRSDQTIAAITIGGTTFGPWQGALGLAPAWYEANNDQQTTAEQERVSACLMAHVNATGTHVVISVRSDEMEAPSGSEMAQYAAFEGQFFGNIMGSDPVKAACRASTESGAATLSQLQSVERLCAAYPQLCNFLPTPECSDICSGWSSSLGIYTECAGLDTVATYIDP